MTPATVLTIIPPAMIVVTIIPAAVLTVSVISLCGVGVEAGIEVAIEEVGVNVV